MTAHQYLRAATAEDHAQVDRAFGRFRLTERQSYEDFLLAHARAVPAVEDALRAGGLSVRARWPLLKDDLDDLDLPAPRPIAPPSWTGAGLLGALYVLEGSRLGGSLLARSVPSEWPRRYLSAAHQRGEWRALLAMIDARLGDDPDRLGEAVTAARETFALYDQAATLAA